MNDSSARHLFAPQPNPLAELGLLRDLAKLPLLPLHRFPRGSGRVLVVPGFLTGDGSTVALRFVLARLGYDVSGWGLGRNHGNVEVLLPRLVERTRALAGQDSIRLVGWSLGGYLSREVAREVPELVTQVITLASPVVGGPKYTTASHHYRGRGTDLDAIEARIAERDNTHPLRTPVTALYSKRDAIVCPEACIDRVNAHVEHVQVDCSHTAFGFNRRVIEIVAETLALGPETES